MQFETKTEAGKFENYYIDRITGITHKVLFDRSRNFLNLFEPDSTFLACQRDYW